MHDEREVRRRSELVQLLRQQQRVRAQEHELLPLHQLADQDVDLRVHERLAARDRHHGSPALLHGGERLLNRHPLLQHAGRLLDLAAARAFEVAGEQGLQLDDQRELLVAAQFLAHQVAPHPKALAQRHAHGDTVFLVSTALSSARRSSLGSPNWTDSVATTTSSVVTSPRPPRAATICPTMAGGAEAPAAIPMVDAPASQPSWMSSALSTR